MLCTVRYARDAALISWLIRDVQVSHQHFWSCAPVFACRRSCLFRMFAADIVICEAVGGTVLRVAVVGALHLKFAAGCASQIFSDDAECKHLLHTHLQSTRSPALRQCWPSVLLPNYASDTQNTDPRKLCGSVQRPLCSPPPPQPQAAS